MKKGNQIAGIITALLLFTGQAMAEPTQEKAPEPRPVLSQVEAVPNVQAVPKKSEGKKKPQVRKQKVESKATRKSSNRKSHFLMPPLDFDNVF